MTTLSIFAVLPVRLLATTATLLLACASSTADVVENYDKDKTLIAKLNAACRQGKYTDDLWKEMTGKPLAELNDEWKAAIQQQLTAKTESPTNPRTE